MAASGVPFLKAYIGNPRHQAFYNICYLAHNCVALDIAASDNANEEV